MQADARVPRSSIVEESMTMATADLHRFADAEQPVERTRVMRAEGAEDGSTPDAPAAGRGGAYRIGAGDTLYLKSYDDDSLSGQVRVRYDGYVSLPLIPDIYVDNVTREEATERLRVAFSKIFTEPRLSLSILEVGSKSYFVMGDVGRTGEFPYTRPLTLLDTVNLAGGPRVNTRGGDSFIGSQGQLVQVFVIRHESGMRNVYEYSLSDLTRSGPHEADTPIYPNDIVYVPEGKNLVYVFGEVLRPDVFELTEGMTLLHLLTLAGGPQLVTSRLKHVVLMHQVSETETKIELINLQQILKTGINPRMTAGDIVFVPRKRLLRLSEFVGRFTGSISPLLSLYNQAFDTYYADKRNRLLFGSQGQGTAPTSSAAPLTLESVVSMLPVESP